MVFQKKLQRFHVRLQAFQYRQLFGFDPGVQSIHHKKYKEYLSLKTTAKITLSKNIITNKNLVVSIHINTIFFKKLTN